MITDQVEIINKSKHQNPEYKTEDSAGMDLYANIEEDIILKPLERTLIPTGLFLAIPQGYEAQIRPRSGLALKKGLTCLNSPGTIDADYRGEIGVIIANVSNEDVIIKDGERIAQMVFAKYAKMELKEVNTLSKTVRGTGGFGSTGV